ncbi:MAG: hypothetical protein Q4G70_09190 [Pseudomonadota bacterium]|nr:hypothetical protein [Pseudomonadota bacterium]
MSIKIFADTEFFSDFFSFLMEKTNVCLYHLKEVNAGEMILGSVAPNDIESARKYILTRDNFVATKDNIAFFEPRVNPFFSINIGGIYTGVLEHSWINNPSAGFPESKSMIRAQKEVFKEFLRLDRIGKGVVWVDGRGCMGHEISSIDKNIYYQNSASVTSLKWVDFVGNIKFPTPPKFWCEPFPKR